MCQLMLLCTLVDYTTQPARSLAHHCRIVAVQVHALCLQAAIVAIVALFFYFLRPGKGGTYLVDFYCVRPPNR